MGRRAPQNRYPGSDFRSVRASAYSSLVSGCKNTEVAAHLGIPRADHGRGGAAHHNPVCFTKGLTQERVANCAADAIGFHALMLPAFFAEPEGKFEGSVRIMPRGATDLIERPALMTLIVRREDCIIREAIHPTVQDKSLVNAAVLLIPEHLHPMRSPVSRLYRVRALPHTHPVSRAIVF